MTTETIPTGMRARGPEISEGKSLALMAVIPEKPGEPERRGLGQEYRAAADPLIRRECPFSLVPTMDEKAVVGVPKLTLDC